METDYSRSCLRAKPQKLEMDYKYGGCVKCVTSRTQSVVGEFHTSHCGIIFLRIYQYIINYFLSQSS